MDLNGIKSDIFVIIGLSLGGYGLFLCYGLGIMLMVLGALSFLIGVQGHRNNSLPKKVES